MKLKMIFLIVSIAMISSLAAVNLKTVFQTAVLNNNGTYTVKSIYETRDAVYKFADKNNLEIIDVTTKNEVKYGVEVELIIDVTFKNKGNTFANEFTRKIDKIISLAEKGRIGTKTNIGYLNEGYLITPENDASWDFRDGIPQHQLELYMKEKGYWYEITKTDYFHYTSPELLTLQFVVNPNLSMIEYKARELAHENYVKQQAQEERERIEENRRLEKEKIRNSEIQYNEKKYKEDVANAKMKASSNPKWSFIEYSDGYYVGETKDGKREGYGELYFKSTNSVYDIQRDNVSYLGYWKNDKFDGQGKFKYRDRNGGAWLEEYVLEGNYVNGLIEGEGNFWRSGKVDFVKFYNGKIVLNYTQTERDEDYRKKQQNKVREEKIQACNDCVVDYEKTSYPHKESEFIYFTVDKPGKIVMKNGEEYEFYYSSGRRPWYISTGFLQTKDFDTFERMLSELTDKCIEKKCK